MDNTKHPFELVTQEIARTMDRQGLIDYLCWVDPDGKYCDKESMAEFKNVLSKQDALQLVYRHLRKRK